jgi:hypothetical protein
MKQHDFSFLAMCPKFGVLARRKNAGKWVASKGSRVIAVSAKLQSLMEKVEARDDRDLIRFDRVPKHDYYAGCCSIPAR